MDAEKIILTKNFYELSPIEKEVIKEYAQNEKDFNEIKSFLLATQQTFNQEKLKTSESLNAAILNELHQPIQQKKTWYNALLLFLFPENKSFYQYPAFQIGIASLLLLITFNILNQNISNDSLAVNDKIKTQPKFEDNINAPTTIEEREEVETKMLEINSDTLTSNNNDFIIQTKTIDEETIESTPNFDQAVTGGLSVENEEVEVVEDEVMTVSAEQEKPAVVSMNESFMAEEVRESIKDEKNDTKKKTLFSKSKNTSAYSSKPNNKTINQTKSISFNNTQELNNLFFISE